MEKRRPISEDDILLTELLIARSLGNLKQSVVRKASRTLSSAGGTVKKHPYATAGAAVGAGIILYGLFRLMKRKGSPGMSDAGGREYTSQPNVTMEILSMMMPIIAPYITTYVEKYLGKAFSRGRN